MKLVIAEKPSVAQSIAHVIGAAGRKDGYLEGPCRSSGPAFRADRSGAETGYLVSWCVGHFLNYVLRETEIRSLHECTIDVIREFLKASRTKADGGEYNRDTWLRYRDYLTDFLILYQESCGDRLPFLYSGGELRNTMILRDEQRHRKVVMAYPACRIRNSSRRMCGGYNTINTCHSSNTGNN